MREDIIDWGFRLAPPHALALFRIALGAVLFVMWLFVLPQMAELPTVQKLLLFAVLLNLILVILGAWIRIASAVIAAVYGYQWWLFTYAGPDATNVTTGGAALFLFLTFLILACSSADRAFSMLMVKRYGTFWEWEDIPLLPQRLLGLLISGFYLIIGYHWLWQPLFRSGASLQSALIGPWGTALAAQVARRLPTSTFNWITYTLKAFGLMLPVCLWIRSVRLWFMLGGALLHLAMAMLLNVWWTLILIPGYLLFLDPEEAQELYKKLIKRVPQS
jgi:hypothetical protein